MTSLDKAVPIRPIEIFYSYAHEDERFRSKLEKHLSILKILGFIKEWHDRKIISGQQWADEIDSHINTAQIILLLISDDFLASDYCWGVEIKRAMKRQEAGEVIVIPIILRPVVWEGAPFGKLQALPTDGKPVTSRSWRNSDEAFSDVARGIQKVVKKLIEKEREVLFVKEADIDLEKIEAVSTGARILLVEDDMQTSQGILTIFQHYNPKYNITIVSDGVEALSIVRKRSFDLILLDLALPEIGGLEVIRQLRKAGNNIPILILSAAAPSVIARGLSLGADDYVEVPYDPQYLYKHVNSLLRRT